MFHHSKSGASEGREEAKKIAEVVVTTWEQIAESPKFSHEQPKIIEKLRVFDLPPLVGSSGGRVENDFCGVTTGVSPHAGARESNSPPPVRRFGTKRRFCLSVSTKMPTFAAAIPPQSTARQGSPGVFAAAEASFTTILKH